MEIRVTPHMQGSQTGIMVSVKLDEKLINYSKWLFRYLHLPYPRQREGIDKRITEIGIFYPFDSRECKDFADLGGFAKYDVEGVIEECENVISWIDRLTGVGSKAQVDGYSLA